MYLLYFDTSSILTYWIVDEEYYKQVSELFSEDDVTEKLEKERKPRYSFTGFVSGLVLIEIASVVERQQNKFTVNSQIDLSKEYIRSVLKLPNITLIDPIIDDLKSLLTYPMYTETIRLAPILKLDSLDNLHLAIISLLRKNGQHQISHFVTGDKEILNNREIIRSEIGIQVVTPDQVLEALK